MPFADTDLVDVAKFFATLAGGGVFTALGIFISKVMRERRQNIVVDTDQSLKKDKAKIATERARLTIDQDRFESAWENQQKVLDDIYVKYQEVCKSVETLQARLLTSEVERAVAVTQLHECSKRVEELQRRLDFLEKKGA